MRRAPAQCECAPNKDPVASTTACSQTKQTLPLHLLHFACKSESARARKVSTVSFLVGVRRMSRAFNDLLQVGHRTLSKVVNLSITDKASTRKGLSFLVRLLSLSDVIDAFHNVICNACIEWDFGQN
ncbi:uncharacterized protein SPPG_09260 [Spizellomyces punctatus DAOM BR117]|uniref:Uncharacterized protein n=1 Tax=Spizellomyces punctatus (strain DAOM BR117) TaxID=645134 RepID=A0A0L0HFS3_SPIPD|nr:uncharacterized protein SPPG_09260 [Spizellomyces punctatus DAOM BR117]KNC99774.1 hypothetical protein SPPG_09260 [Spizellomyces punctatus DAOM BR117]|eukprot:XP_016607814.1 hypothetical protein SPPG_09260 [Spizellomyces punctatus DAOM BR117]